MSLAVLAVLFSAFLHPVMASFSKKANHPLTLNFWGVIVATLIFSYVYFDVHFWGKVFLHWDFILYSSLLHSVYVIIILQLLAKHEFQVLYPLTRLAPILILVGEILFFGTEFSLYQIGGIVSIIAGALVFGFDKKMEGVRLGIFFQICLITALVAGYFLVDKKLLEVFSPAEMWAMVGFQIPLLIYILFMQKKAAIADLKNWKNLFGFTFAMIGTWGLALYGLSHLDGAVVSSVRNLSILFGIFLGAHLFNEGHKWLRYAAGLLICGGVIFVFL